MPPAAAAASAVVAGEFVHEDFPPATPERPAAPAPRPAPPPIQLDWPSDLVQVESDPGKVKTVIEQAREEAPAPRQKRERPVRAPVAEEPLVQIETQKGN
jgi:hypothetical protein